MTDVRNPDVNTENDSPQDAVYADYWNPPSNRWAPSDEPHGVWGAAEPSHGDDPNAMPQSDVYGDPQTAASGTVPDVRKNLLTDVLDQMQAAAPTIVHHHVVETVERGTEAIRIHQEQPAGITPVVVLTQNPQRKRALIKNRNSSTPTAQPSIPASTTATNATITVPAGQTWSNFASFQFQLVTSAAVGNRILSIQVLSALNQVIASYTTTVAQTAGQTVEWIAQTGLTTDVVSGSNHYFPNILNGLTLQAGQKISITTIAGGDAGDAYSGFLGEFYNGLGGVFLVPLHDGGNAVAAGLGWQLAPGEQIEVKSQAGIEAVTAAGDSAILSVYEELLGTVPGEPSLSS